MLHDGTGVPPLGHVESVSKQLHIGASTLGSRQHTPPAFAVQDDTGLSVESGCASEQVQVSPNTDS